MVVKTRKKTSKTNNKIKKTSKSDNHLRKIAEKYESELSDISDVSQLMTIILFDVVNKRKSSKKYDDGDRKLVYLHIHNYLINVLSIIIGLREGLYDSNKALVSGGGILSGALFSIKFLMFLFGIKCVFLFLDIGYDNLTCDFDLNANPTKELLAQFDASYLHLSLLKMEFVKYPFLPTIDYSSTLINIINKKYSSASNYVSMGILSDYVKSEKYTIISDRLKNYERDLNDSFTIMNRSGSKTLSSKNVENVKNAFINFAWGCDLMLFDKSMCVNFEPKSKEQSLQMKIAVKSILKNRLNINPRYWNELLQYMPDENFKCPKPGVTCLLTYARPDIDDGIVGYDKRNGYSNEYIADVKEQIKNNWENLKGLFYDSKSASFESELNSMFSKLEGKNGLFSELINLSSSKDKTIRDRYKKKIEGIIDIKNDIIKLSTKNESQELNLKKKKLKNEILLLFHEDKMNDLKSDDKFKNDAKELVIEVMRLLSLETNGGFTKKKRHRKYRSNNTRKN